MELKPNIIAIKTSIILSTNNVITDIYSLILDRETANPIIIDFPQMVSTLHTDAAYFFNRDVKCLQDFFRRRYYQYVLKKVDFKLQN